MPVSAPSDRRFRRSRVHPAKRRRFVPSWRTAVTGIVVAAAAGYGALRAAELAASSGALTISTITVAGTDRMAPGEVLALLEGLRGQQMVTIDLESWRQKLLAAPWVADATLRRGFPGTVSVVITEQEPLGIGRIGGALYLIDRHGTVIDEFGPRYADFDLPIIDGLSVPRAPRPAEAGDPTAAQADGARAMLAGRLLADFQRQPSLAGRISQVDVSNVRNAIVILKDDPALIYVGDDHFVDRVQAYIDYAERLREQVSQIDYVDVRYDDRVFVKPQKTAGR